MKATGELDVAPGQRIRWRAEAPVVLRRTGPARVHLVQAAGGPLGGDQLDLHIRLAAGTELTVATAAATVAQPGRPGSGPAFWTVTAELDEGARLHWLPEPTVVCDGAELHATFRLTLAEGAAAVVREQVQLGRHGQRGGRYRGVLAADYAGAALVRHTTLLDGADPALTGPAGTGGQRLVGTVLGAGTASASALPGAASAPAGGPLAAALVSGPPVGECAGLRWARHELAGPGWLLVALGSDPVALSRVLSGSGSAGGRGPDAAGPGGSDLGGPGGPAHAVPAAR
ncbi:MAG TPA: urease accessory protein UreD [Pseudonocardia sp.]|nr:urease accessory protein UreD [Pseudonocardia sp.]